jgi:N-acetylneuraminic acid mutarotase
MNMRQNRIWVLISLVLGGLLCLAFVSLAQDSAWARKSNMPTPRTFASSCVVNGTIYIIGGWGFEEFFEGVESEVLAAVEAYDPVADIWIKRMDMPTARDELSTSAVNGLIYTIGGWRPSQPLSTVEVYDPVADTWTGKANMPAGRLALSTSAVNGIIYAIGGYIGGVPQSTTEAYDPVTDTWTEKSDMPTPRGYFSTSAVNGIIYAIGGWDNQTSTTLASVEAYDTATDTWTRKADMPRPKLGISTSVVNGIIYVVGGYGTVSTVEAYDPVTDTWTGKPDIPTPRGLLRSESVNGKLYAIGGGTDTTNNDPLEEGVVEEYNWLLAPARPSQSVDAWEKLLTLWGRIKWQTEQQ